MSILKQEIDRRGGRPAAAPATRVLARPWLLFLRCLGFASYALAAAALGVAVIPAVRGYGRLRGWRADELDLTAQWLIHRTTYHQTRLVERLGVARITGVGTEKLAERPLLVVANHPSLYDTPVLTRFLPQADFIVSSEWSRNPFFRGATRGGGYLDAGSGALALRTAVKRLRSGRTLVLYPEGSRSLPEGLRPFQRGAAMIALRTGFDILPVVIRVTPRTLMKGQSVMDMPEGCPEWRVEVGDPIHPSDYLLPGEANAVGARRLTAVLQEHFEKRWDSGS